MALRGGPKPITGSVAESLGARDGAVEVLTAGDRVVLGHGRPPEEEGAGLLGYTREDHGPRRDRLAIAEAAGARDLDAGDPRSARQGDGEAGRVAGGARGGRGRGGRSGAATGALLGAAPRRRAAPGFRRGGWFSRVASSGLGPGLLFGGGIDHRGGAVGRDGLAALHPALARPQPHRRQGGDAHQEDHAQDQRIDAVRLGAALVACGAGISGLGALHLEGGLGPAIAGDGALDHRRLATHRAHRRPHGRRPHGRAHRGCHGQSRHIGGGGAQPTPGMGGGPEVEKAGEGGICGRPMGRRRRPGHRGGHGRGRHGRAPLGPRGRDGEEGGGAGIAIGGGLVVIVPQRHHLQHARLVGPPVAQGLAGAGRRGRRAKGAAREAPPPTGGRGPLPEEPWPAISAPEDWGARGGDADGAAARPALERKAATPGGGRSRGAGSAEPAGGPSSAIERRRRSSMERRCPRPLVRAPSRVGAGPGS